MARGQQRYNIHCLPCHGATGDGKVTPVNMMVAVVNFDARLVSMTDGEIFNTITHGKNLRFLRSQYPVKTVGPSLATKKL